MDDLTDSSANQGIGYAADDVSGDSTMWRVLLYMIIVIMAFVFVVLTSGTIEEESAIIGTLLASGYRRRELVTHYLALPAAVGIAAAVVGNVAGYTLMSEPIRNLYYGSYSLPPYYATWSWGVFAQTTVLPVATLVISHARWGFCARWVTPRWSSCATKPAKAALSAVLPCPSA